jgi:phosphoribosylglycinamide formyltransferase-1
MSKRVAILISGGGSNMLQLIKSMDVDHPAHPVLVLSNNPLSPGILRAKELGIATKTLDHRPFGKDREQFEAKLDEILHDFQVDIICLAGFMLVLTAGFVNRWDGLVLNTHPSLLPEYKGLNTHSRAIEAGEKNGGCSVHIVNADLDGGPLLGQVKVAIEVDDTAETLAKRVLIQEHKLYPAVLRRFALGQKGVLFFDE